MGRCNVISGKRFRYLKVEDLNNPVNSPVNNPVDPVFFMSDLCFFLGEENFKENSFR